MAELLAAARQAKGWTVREMAKQTGISPSEISRLEHGLKTDVSILVLLTLQRAFGFVSLEYLLGDFPSARIIGEDDTRTRRAG